VRLEVTTFAWPTSLPSSKTKKIYTILEKEKTTVNPRANNGYEKGPVSQVIVGDQTKLLAPDSRSQKHKKTAI